MRKLGLLLSLLMAIQAQGQNTDFDLNHDLYHYVDRLDILGWVDTTVHTDQKPYGREQLTAMFKEVDESKLSQTQKKWFHLMRTQVDDEYALGLEREGKLNFIYPNHRDFFTVKNEQLRLFVNPVLHTSAGVERLSDPNLQDPWLPLTLNTRGAQIRGTLFNQLGFHTEVADNYNRVPYHLFQRWLATELLEGEGFVKGFTPRFGGRNGLDYFTTKAYLTYSPFSGMRIKFGKDRVMWGNGHQSLLLSDQATDYLLLNITTRIWKFEYINHFAQFIDFIPLHNDDEGDFPRKYGAFHLLNFKPNRNFSIGLFESVVYGSYLPNRFRNFEVQYLNPVIFYRSIEQYFGSPDNALLGVQMKANLWRRLQLYGQLVLDDFNFGARNRPGGDLRYWGNKLGYQAGLKYIDAFGISTLDFQVEINQVRPYTYQHFNLSSAYLHYAQPLGHASGANLSDFHLILRYHPWAKVNLQLAYYLLNQGLDQEDLNYGADPGVVTGNRPPDRDFGIQIGEGEAYRLQQVHGRLTYQLWNSDIYLEAEGRYRQTQGGRSASLLLGLRANIAHQPLKN